MSKDRIKFFIGLVLAFTASLLLSPFIHPGKQNKMIPVGPIALNVALVQSGEIVGLKSVTLTSNYPSDYQSEFDSNYYLITILNGNKTLFTGKTVRSYVVIGEDFSGNKVRGTTSEMPLGDFELNLPYYPNATAIVISDEKQRRVLSIDLSQYHLILPQTFSGYCGDGICSDKENIFMCFSDCAFKAKL